MSQIRTRFAPSPTGYLHIGGARTALFNYLFARHHGGRFILRIEDTDRERSTAEAIQAILDAMHWLGLDYDEGPFYQTARLSLYQERIRQLLRQGKAYPCVCTPPELDAKRRLAMKEKRKPAYDGTCRPPQGSSAPLPTNQQFTVRFRSPVDGITVVEDLVKGDVVFENRELDDLIIARSDGMPTYNFCVVADDIDMAITHVIRGDDHLANTPRQIQLYQALGADLPRFAHLPLILGTDKARLSKRHGATSVTAYRDMGYLPEAVNNYLVRLGWSHGDQEIFSREELIEKFSLESVGKSAGVFNPEKFLWLNSQYLKAQPLTRLADEVVPYIQAQGYAVPPDRVWLQKMIGTLQERAKTLVELVDSARYYLTDDIALDEKTTKKFLTREIAQPLTSLIERLSTLNDFSESAIEREFAIVLSEHGLSMGQLAQPVRAALTGSTVSPGIHDVIAVLGKERTLRRLRSALQSLPRS
jgi:glutamyl-tRNA synthetase